MERHWSLVSEDGTGLVGEDAGKECKASNMPAWDRLMSDLADIIREDDMYPEEMPWECFDVVPMGCYDFY